MSNTSTLLANGELITTMLEMNHEQVVFCTDKDTGLKAIIAIHNTVLGPSLGGTRFWNYTHESEALIDVLRLSRGMTYKSSLCGNNLGGGKAVIIGDSRALKNREMFFRSYGKFVQSLCGRYITAEDVGTSTSDMEFISNETKYVAGLPETMGGGGDPSPVTAYGVYLGLKASVKYSTGSDNLQGKKVMVQGTGNVGGHLIDHLIKDGATVFISDIYEDRIKKITSKHQVEVVEPDKVYDMEVDIYAPCALGATLNDETISRLKCSIVAGAANNQLKEEIKHGRALKEKGILYAPDYLINAGGVINCYIELEGYNRERAMKNSEVIYSRAIEIFEVADQLNLTTQQAANQLAEERIAAMAKINARM